MNELEDIVKPPIAVQLSEDLSPKTGDTLGVPVLDATYLRTLEGAWLSLTKGVNVSNPASLSLCLTTLITNANPTKTEIHQVLIKNNPELSPEIISSSFDNAYLIIKHNHITASDRISFVTGGGHFISVSNNKPTTSVEELILHKGIKWASELKLAKKAWLVDSIMGANDMIQIVGASELGKSFLIIDIALSCIYGLKWLEEYDTTPCNVMYLACEMSESEIAKRITGWHQERNIPVDPAKDFIVFPNPVDFLGNTRHPAESRVTTIDDVLSITPALLAKKQLNSSLPLLIIVDTKARNAIGLDENASSDSGAILENCDRLRKELNATLVVIHHEPKRVFKQPADGSGRGHGSFFNGIDTNIWVDRDEDEPAKVLVKNTKQRGAAKFDTIEITLKPQTIELEDGEMDSTVVVMPFCRKSKPTSIIIDGKVVNEYIFKRSTMFTCIQHQPFTSSEMFKWFVESGNKTTDRSIRTWLTDLVTAGMVSCAAVHSAKFTYSLTAAGEQLKKVHEANIPAEGLGEPVFADAVKEV